jgi:hypothetical protein
MEASLLEKILRSDLDMVIDSLSNGYTDRPAWIFQQLRGKAGEGQERGKEISR